MKNKVILLIPALSIFIIFSGCIATHTGNMSNSASLDSPNFVYKKQNISGETKATYILGIGGAARQSLIFEAKKNMIATNPLLKNQALANVTASYKTTYFIAFIVITVRCTVSADIVEFVSDQANSSQSQNNNSPVILSQDNTIEKLALSPTTSVIQPEDNSSKPKQKTVKPSEKPIPEPKFKVGDKVTIINYFPTPVDGKVLEIVNDRIFVEYTNPSGKTKKVKLKKYQLRKME